MGNSQLSVRVEENLGLEYSGKVRLVDEAKIKGYEIFICKNKKNKSVIRERVQ